jgi:hypothetical protein
MADANCRGAAKLKSLQCDEYRRRWRQRRDRCHRADKERDRRQLAALLDRLIDPLPSFAGNGAYDQNKVYRAIATRHPEAAVIVPP